MNGSVSAVNRALEQYALPESNDGPSQALGQTEFLELMMVQLRNQDPLKPMDSNDFLGQIAQFGTVNGITELTESFSGLMSSLQSSQALQASTLVGRSVLIEGRQAPLGSGGVSGALDLPAASGQVVLDVKDVSGQLVRRIDLGAQNAGLVQFNWDGLDASGVALPPARYNLSATAAYPQGTEQVQTYIRAKVDSVSLVPGGAPRLNLNQLGSIGLGDVREVM